MKPIYKYLFSPILILTFGCHYNKANMKIRNETDRQICYSTLAKNIDNRYYAISAGGKIDSHDYDSPIVRGSSEGLKRDINSYSDKLIYIAFYNPEEQQYVFKNLDSMMHTEKLKILKFSKKELDGMNWTITYTEK